jgi:hypothetical protein
VQEVVLALDQRGVHALIAELTARRQHLDHGAPLPGYDSEALHGRRLAYVMWEIRDQLGLGQMYNMGPPNPYAGAMKDAIVMTLRLNAATARDLEAALYDLGEHIAAGAPVGRGSDEAEACLDALLARLEQHRIANAF